MNNSSTTLFPPSPVTVPLLLLAVFGLLFGRGATVPDGNEAGRQQSAGERHELSPETQTLSGLYAIPSSRWDDPFQGLTDARNYFERTDSKKVSQNTSKNDRHYDYCHVFAETLKGEPDSPPSLMVLPILIESGDDRLRDRLNARHVVESGLASCGFTMQFTDTMSYALCPGICISRPNNGKATHDWIVPLKLYKSEKDKYVLAMWIDQRHLGEAPLNVIDQILAGLFECDRGASSTDTPSTPNNIHQLAAVDQLRCELSLDRTTELFMLELIKACRPGSARCDSQIAGQSTPGGAGASSHHRVLKDGAHLAILGPTNSDVLRTILREAQTSGDPSEPICGVDWKHGAAIYSYAATVSAQEMGESNQRTIASRDESETAEASGQGLRLRHFIGTNEQLIERLSGELLRRGLISVDASLQREVVLFYEQDRLFTQSLRDLLVEKLGFANRDRVTLVPFLPDLSRRPNGDAANEGGRDVTDYFARTIREIANGKHASDFQPNRVGVVGVLATNPRDAAVILKSVRPLFPNAQWFLFDRDVELENTAGNWNTRNVLLASHYALRVDSDLVPSAPSFRNSYQTSQFVALSIALMSFQENRQNDDTYISPGTRQDLFDLWGRFPPPADTQRSSLQPVTIELGLRGDDIYSQPTSGNDDRVRQPGPGWERTTLKRVIALLAALLPVGFFAIVLAQAYSGDIRQGLESLIASIRGTVRPKPELNDQASAAVGETNRRLGILTIASVMLLLILILFVIYEDGRFGGERFSVASGTSIWPSVFLFYVIVVLAVPSAIEGLVLGARVKRLAGRQPDLDKLGQFESDEDDWKRSVSVTLLLLAVLLIFGWWGGDYGWVPARSLLGRWVGWSMQFLACIAVFLSVGVTATLALATRNLIRRRADTLLRDLKLRATGTPRVPASETISLATQYVHWVEEITERLSRRFLLPSICILLLMVARLPVWDGWPVNHLLAAAVGTPVLLALICGFAVRSEARTIRGELIQATDAQIASLGRSATESADDDRSVDGQSVRGEKPETPVADIEKSLRWFRDVLARADRGAFGSPLRDPLLGSFVFLVTAIITESGNSWILPFVQVIH